MSEVTNLLREAQGPAGRRLLLFGIAAAAIVTVWVVAHQMTAPTYVTLFRDLDLKESARSATSCARPTLTSGFRRRHEVQVPVAQIATARVALAREGLPSTGRPGLELFDKASWGMTDFTQRVTYQRALEGELARTIGGLSGIQSAQVHLVLPASSNLRRLERSGSASVVVTFKSAGSLSPETVHGIIYIVTNSVEQLSTDNVAVMDDAGHVLSVPAAPGAAGGGGQPQSRTRAHARRTARGTHRGHARHRRRRRPRARGGRRDHELRPGRSHERVVRSRWPGAAERAAQRRRRHAIPTRSQTVVNNSYQNSHKVERSVGATGGVKKLTIAVLVDKTAIGGAKNVSVDQLREMARDAVGVDSTRGDRLTVNAVAFEPLAVPQGTPSTAPKPAPDFVSMFERVGRPLLAVAAIVTLLVLALRVLRSPTGAAAGGGTMPAGPGGPIAGPDTNELALLRQRLLAEPGPDATTQVLRAWLADTK